MVVAVVVDDDEEVEEDDPLRVSPPVLHCFSLRLLASGAFSTLFKNTPSRFPRLNACKHEIKSISP